MAPSVSESQAAAAAAAAAANGTADAVAAEAPSIDPPVIEPTSDMQLRSPVLGTGASTGAGSSAGSTTGASASGSAGGANGADSSNGPSGSIVYRVLNGHVGVSNLPQQWHRKSMRKGFHFNIMVVGESGLGKTTLVSTLFNNQVLPPRPPRQPGAELPKTVKVTPYAADLEENNIRLHLTVIDTPGFGDFVNNHESWSPIVEEIERRFNGYLEAEKATNRSKIVDERVHACVYFIQPTGHALKPLDVMVMKKLHRKVNLVPVIAKADTLTDEEVQGFKERILADLRAHQIEYFRPPQWDNDDEETIQDNQTLMAAVPFAIVGSTETVQLADGRTVRGRHYPWGTIEVDNEDHCDFVKLRQLLIRHHLEALRERTANELYEDYRTEKLESMGVQQDHSVFREVNPARRLEEERAMHEQRLRRMETDMRAVFQQKVHEKEQKLKNSEAELFRKHKEMKDQLEKQRAELEARKARLEEAKAAEDKKTTRKGFLNR